MGIFGSNMVKSFHPKYMLPKIIAILEKTNSNSKLKLIQRKF